MANRLLYAACCHRVLHDPNLESPTALTWEQLIDQLQRKVRRYLLSTAGP